MKTLTRTQAARRLGVTVSAVRCFERAGMLNPSKRDGRWLFEPEEVQDLAHQRANGGGKLGGTFVLSEKASAQRNSSTATRQQSGIPAEFIVSTLLVEHVSFWKEVKATLTYRWSCLDYDRWHRDAEQSLQAYIDPSDWNNDDRPTYDDLQRLLLRSLILWGSQHQHVEPTTLYARGAALMEKHFKLAIAAQDATARPHGGTEQSKGLDGLFEEANAVVERLNALSEDQWQELLNRNRRSADRLRKIGFLEDLCGNWKQAFS